jgi:ribosomal protein S18 acetylase RimI-like enzyme
MGDLTLGAAFSRRMDMNTSTITPTEIRRAAGADVGAVADVLARAFFTDPVFRWCLPDDDRRAAILHPFFSLVTSALLPYDDVHLTTSGGVALWVPPGQPPVPEREAPRFEEGLGELMGVDGERTFAIVELLEANHPEQPSHYLWFLAVRPEAQGLGVGSSLLSSRLAECDRTSTPAYLEATSPSNRRLYERHGFEVVNEIAVADSPPIWPMWRPPAAV